MGTERLDALVRQVRDLPALPTTVIRVMQLSNDPKAGVADVARALISDQALAARVLKLANSAFYGASRRIATVSDAVVILGMRTTRNLVMASGCQELLESEVAGYGLPRGTLLRHSLACASGAQALAKRTKYRGVEEAFVAGLLHDLGKVVMNLYGRDQFLQVLIQAASGEMTYADAEHAVFSFDHAEAGAYLLERWNLPATLIAAVRHHHAPLDAPTDSPLPCLVHVADAICLTLGIGLGLDGLAYTLQPEALVRLGLTADDFEAVAGEICDTLTEAGTVF
jgi:putative nucleotidyltransferase with HDIG domain